MRVLAPTPDPVLLLRDVRELEVEREGSQDERLLLSRDRPQCLAGVRDYPPLPRRTSEQPNTLDRIE
jgi:hypothetical protein